MRAVDLIAQKRNGGQHDEDALRWLVTAYLRDEVPDYQMAAWLMAVCWRGLDAGETRTLTLALADSGRRLRFAGLDRPVVDKHSTGGVGDKTTLVLAPLLAASGVAVAKMSGRGLGHTGGTIDKLESIPGVRTAVDADTFVAAVRERGLAVAAQSADLVPGDGRLYALRDATATVESIPLIASSVMSKKIATGAQTVVLDVKAGRGAFMKDRDSARALATAMVDLGRSVDLPAVVVISGMDQPLGHAIGNSLEVQEAIATLRGGGPDDLVALCLALGMEALVAAGAASSPRAARERLERALTDGSALTRLRDLVQGMGGERQYVDHPERLPAAPHVTTIPASRAGYVAAIDALACGEAAMLLGAGRATKEASIDPRVGLVLHAKAGEWVEQGQPLVTIHSREPVAVDSVEPAAHAGEAARQTGRPDDTATANTATAAARRVLAAFRWSETAITPPPLILDVIR